VLKSNARWFLFLPLSLMGAAGATAATPGDGAESDSNGQLDEITVTAQRREERLDKVPISISAYTGEQLQHAGITDMADIARDTPGFASVPGATIGGGANISIRGVSTSQGAATVGIYLDDVPLQGRANNWTQPIDPGLFDMQRVEVLRGPQGTLYGASSEGGTVRYITTPPSLTTWSGEAQAGVSGNERGGIGYETAAAVGGPIIENALGFRVSVDSNRAPGYIDQVSRATGDVLNSNINPTDNITLRAALTAAPVEGLTITPAFFYQHMHSDDDGVIWSDQPIWPTTGEYQSREEELTPYTDESKVGSLKVEYDFGPAVLTSVSSGYWRDLNRADDYSLVAAYQFFKNATPTFLAGDPNFASPQLTETTQKTYSQEIRLSSTDQNALFYGTAGFYFSHSVQDLTQEEWGAGGSSLPPGNTLLPGGPLIPGSAFNIYVPNGPIAGGGILADKYQTEVDQQTAGFVDVTWNVAPGLKAAAGVRVGREDYSYQYIGNGDFQGGEQILPKTDSSTTVVNPRFNTSYQFTDDDMAYVSVAKGNRPGGANRPIPAARCALDIAEAGGSIPQSYSDDSVWSYEVGTKDRFLDRKIAIEGSVYYLDWRNVQQALSLSNCAFSYVGNFGSATSKGFDLSTRFTPIQNVELGVKAGYTDTELSQNVLGSVSQTTGVAPILATKGSALTFVPKWTADVDVEYRHSLPWDGTTGFARVDYQYEGSYVRTPGAGSTLFNPVTYYGASYYQLDFRTGVTKDAWQGTFFINNITNQYPILFLDAETGTTGFANLESTLAPRTFGAKVSYSW
jgi:iron complex outermembrane recepter protein